MPLSIPTAPERDLLAVTYDKVKEIRVVDTDDQSKVLAIENLAIAGTKVTVAVEGIDATDVNGALAEHQADIETLGTEKVSTTTEVIAGAGLTGGGALGTSRTLNVAATNDSVVVADDGIKVDTQNVLNSTSTTKPLSAAQGKVLNDGKVDKTSIANNLTTTAAGSVLDARQGKILDEADKTIIADIKAVAPASAFNKRMAALGATVDKQALLKVYMETIQRLPSTQVLYIPQCGLVERTSGVNKYSSLVGDMSANNNDATQSTEATQPFVGGYIAPSEMRCIKRVTGQTQTGLLSFATAKNFLATDSWTLRVRRRINLKGTGRLYLGANSYMSVGDSSVLISNGTNKILTCSATLEAGRTHTIEFQYSNGTGLIKINNIPYTTTVVSAAMTFDRLAYNSTYPVDCCMFSYHLSNTRASEIEGAQAHAFLQSMFPDMESVAIGNQVWTTSNFEGIVAGDGTVVPEVQGATTDGNPELVPQPLDFTSWWSTTGSATVMDADTVTTIGSGGVHRTSAFKTGRIISVSIKGVCTGAPLLLRSSTTATVYKTFAENIPFDETIYFKSVDSTFYLHINGVGQLDLESLSIKEVGASDSTLVYNYVYDATSGTAAVKDLAATKAAAMCCHYDNLAANGAVYGKMYNWYAVHLFDLYPPVKGWRVPSKADFDQLVANQGGSTVAGGKLKAKFGSFNNTYSTNESGLSLNGCGIRLNTGAWATFLSVIYGTNTYARIETSTAEQSFGSLTTELKAQMYSLRLLRNEPAGLNELSYTSGLFTTDITSAAKQIPISFGRTVDYIRIKSENSLTAIEAKLYNAAGTAVATLITGKAIGAGETKMFAVTADWVSLLQDGSVRVTAAGNSGSAVGMEIEVLTHKGVLS